MKSTNRTEPTYIRYIIHIKYMLILTSLINESRPGEMFFVEYRQTDQRRGPNPSITKQVLAQYLALLWSPVLNSYHACALSRSALTIFNRRLCGQKLGGTTAPLALWLCACCVSDENECLALLLVSLSAGLCESVTWCRINVECCRARARLVMFPVTGTESSFHWSRVSGVENVVSCMNAARQIELTTKFREFSTVFVES